MGSFEGDIEPVEDLTFSRRTACATTIAGSAASRTMSASSAGHRPTPRSMNPRPFADSRLASLHRAGSGARARVGNPLFRRTELMNRAAWSGAALALPPLDRFPCRPVR